MAISRPGPKKGSTGAEKIAQAHRGSHEHDMQGGFAANPERARDAGRKGGQTVKEKYGEEFYREIGKRGGNTVKAERGSEFYAEIGRKGGTARSLKMKQGEPKDHI